MNLSPIVLFVYNRPEHALKTLLALKENELADRSTLFIFADGPKLNASDTLKQKIREVREIIRSQKWCKEVNITESDKNKGLANSIIDGVSEVIQKYGRVIVLEDDILPSPGFLKYMNDALNLYNDESRVGCIHAWNYNLDLKNYKESTFFLKGADCWGWGTWERAWREFNPNGKELLNAIKEKDLAFEFSRRNSHAFVKMLKDQIADKNDSWAIRWHASLVVKNMYCLHPTRPIIKNIGLDNSGMHCGELDIGQKPIDYLKLQKIPIEESDWFFEAYYEVFHLTPTKWQKLKILLKSVFRQ
jgi:hypothetical protein